MGARTLRPSLPSRAAGGLGSVVPALLYRGRVSVREASVVAVACQAVAFAVYGAHAARGGFILDDWSLAADYRRFSRDDGFIGGLRHLLGASTTDSPTAQGRPIAALYHALTHAAFGTSTGWFLVWAIVLAGLVSALFYVVLRQLRIERIHAFVIALLLLVVPASDSTRLWATGAIALSTMALYLFGLLLALVAFERSGRRALLLHAASLGAYALSLLEYEIAAPLILLAVVPYWLHAPGWAVVRRFAADAVTVAVCLWYVGSHIPRTVPTLTYLRDRAGVIRHQAVLLVERIGIQNGATRLPLVVVAALLLAAGAVVVLRGEESVRRDVRRWFVAAVLGGIAFGAGYGMFVAADPFYTPLNPGIANRTNAAASLGLVVLLYSLAVIAALLLFRAAPQALSAIRGRPRVISARPLVLAAALAFALLTGVAWVRHVNSDARTYQRAYAIEKRALDVLRERVPKPAPGTTIYTFGLPSEASRNVFAFTASWDLTGAVQLLWGDSTLRGIPSPSVGRHFPGNGASDWGLRCGPTELQPRGFFYDRHDASPYGHIIFVDVPQKRAERINARPDCIAAVQQRRSLLEAGT